MAPQFRGRAQQDSHELVCALLSECDDELRRAKKTANDAAKAQAGEKGGSDYDEKSSSSDEEDEREAEAQKMTPTLIEQTFGTNVWNVVRAK
jgi:hypothetical protein